MSFGGLAYAQEQIITIPFGAYDPTFETPVEYWYSPPVLTIQRGDTVTWINEDREGHTVTSGQGAGRFGWMGGTTFGEPDGYFDSDRFLKDESWSFTFDESGLFNYYCTIHPWMEGVIFVGDKIPDYPHDEHGNKIEQFPVIQYTQDNVVEIDMTWEPNVIVTHEPVKLIYQTYDPATNSNLDKMQYTLTVIQNGKSIFHDTGVTGIGGDFRNIIFEDAGPIEIVFEDIQSWGTSAISSPARETPSDITQRTLTFTTMVYNNPDKISHEGMVMQPVNRVELQYEILVAIILVPGGLAIVAVLYMMYAKPKSSKNQSRSAV